MNTNYSQINFKNFLFQSISNLKLTACLSLSLFFCNVIQIQAQSIQAKRYEIDAKRIGITYTSKDALPRGREFKRIDSTYYVGWMLEGTYKYQHAADYLGYKSAATQLEKALALLQKDFAKELKTRTNDVFTYLKVINYHRDWDYTSYALMQCYSNTEEPAKVWQLLQKCVKLDMQDEFYMDAYNYLGWTVHRNRFYTSKKYRFLKTSIDENEKFALKLIDSAAVKVKRDAILNKDFFGSSLEKNKTAAVWHYKSILYTYQLNIKSGAYYYNKLKETQFFPLNNFATFCAIQADFDMAEKYYNLSKNEDAGDKRLNESYYYLSIINQYKGHNKAGMDEINKLIMANGSTPGFGWYNLALSRELIYDGQIAIAKRYANRAAAFKEIHIGTTLGQSHYDFTSGLMNLIIKKKEIEAIKFANKNWWYSPTDISRLAKLHLEKYGLQLLIVNQFAQNPERDRVIYKIFSTESTVSFDEIYQLIEDFSSQYFIDKFKKEIIHDKRVNVKRYYKLFTAKLLIKQEKYQEALSYLNEILQEAQQHPNEKLFYARTIEAMYTCKREIEDKDSHNELLFSLYVNYPQLIPFSSIQMPMRLHTNANNASQKKLIESLQNININWTKSSTEQSIDVYIQFENKANLPVIKYSTKYKNKYVVTEQMVAADKQSSMSLAYSIFDIGNFDNSANIENPLSRK
ncbi:MAG: hypothetical protein IPI46_11290 [Bacteroidetes bacterium]|nr:hypothetical protein [Bacteroidota bacterium]